MFTAAKTAPAKVGRFESTQELATPLEETFSFFSDAHNLNRITPPWVGFRIITPAPIDMRLGTIIDYTIRLRGLSIPWRTEIVSWNPPHSFTDLQLKGPYRWWRHTHTFVPTPRGTRVTDLVEYRAPLHWLTAPLFVRRDIQRIFAYRARALERELVGHAR